MSDLTNRLRVLAIGADCTFTAHVALREAANELDQCNARIEALQNECYASNAEVIVLTAEVQQLRQYLDTAQRRAESLREQLTLAETVRASQVAGLVEAGDKLREALELIAMPMRSDGTWNRERLACQQIAVAALKGRD
jgi:chromosome segregation ATPase